MKILIIGASSYLGAKLYVDLKDQHEIVGTYSTNKLFNKLIKLDVTSRNNVINIVNKVKPDLIIHCANLPKNEPMKKDPILAKKVNLDATKYLVEAANNIKSKFIFISTIASLLNNDFYTSYKLESENITKRCSAGWLVLRPAYILGLSPNVTNDRPFNRILKNITDKTPAIYDTSWKTQSSDISWISEIIDLCINRNIWNQVITISVKEIKNRYEMVNDILKHFNIEVHPVNKKDLTKTISDDQSSLIKLGLPIYTYDQMINRIVKEIKRQLP